MIMDNTFGLKTPSRIEIEPAPPLAAPVFDPEEYRADLAGLNLSDAQETELLETLWHIMGAFARMGFTADVCGLIFDEFNEASAPESGDDKLLASSNIDKETPSADEGERGSI